MRTPPQGTSNWKEPLCLAQVRHAQLLWRNPLYAENAVNLGWTVLIQVFAYSTSHFTLYIHMYVGHLDGLLLDLVGLRLRLLLC